MFRSMVVVLFVAACATVRSEVYSQTPVVRVCFVTTGEDLVVRIEDKKSQASICLWDLGDCKGAELFLRKDTSASLIGYVSKEKGWCR